MASPDLYGALVAFLDGDTGDVRTRINALEPGRLATGSVSISRASRSASAQRGAAVNTPAIDIIVSDNAGAVRGIGIGVQEVDYEVRLEIMVRQKDLPVGKNQSRVLESIRNDLVTMYEGLSNLVITDPAGVATFEVASARRGTIDRTPAKGERETAVVVATFTFIVPMPAN